MSAAEHRIARLATDCRGWFAVTDSGARVSAFFPTRAALIAAIREAFR